ncbi:hypothetical protein LTR10_016818 [Elasticomyces elasticus]|uniref:Polysaccharide pyruvyl transferase domain-containing protein n=1 Tax=Exophiala sideris TaxID=1016849 RepID=A0ABR0JMX1_9EURO|nr:hypothetical protein LTR10_016818 [Elasticomyces elasticus]KAK5037821.1 hypothetical protein LTS07_001288 [Exophiala sideris]KAK5043804.1 hypothetical protein LTR13_000158 [Exophiala sideris]KAK5067303.1 hypothetical protein LTR69_001290 [Exophiala sideris]KAK5182636.1 hypothetical protein LTR44_005027 [Eurotiomycetes sp. CCFEE 6388]
MARWEEVTKLMGSVSGGRAGGTCDATLSSQADMLIREYSALLPGVTHVALIGYPMSSNKGDSAIWIGEKVLLEALGIETVYACVDNHDYNKDQLREALEAHGGPSKTAILLHGGGNFGDLWPGAQDNRESVAMDFLDYRIRSFPQTYKFHDVKKKLPKAQQAYGQHPDLQLTARDSKSFMAMQKDFGSKHMVSLLPDAATMLVTRPLPHAREVKDGYDVLFLARTDHEGGQDHGHQKGAIDDLRSFDNGDDSQHSSTNVTVADWVNVDPEGIRNAVDYDQHAQMRVDWTFEYLQQYALILSDRLHVHILSTVWGFDHVAVEEGSYAKIRTYHDTWLLGCGDRVAMTQNMQEAVDAAKGWYKNGKSFS